MPPVSRQTTTVSSSSSAAMRAASAQTAAATSRAGSSTSNGEPAWPSDTRETGQPLGAALDAWALAAVGRA